jgi:hypothetical protein
MPFMSRREDCMALWLEATELTCTAGDSNGCAVLHSTESQSWKRLIQEEEQRSSKRSIDIRGYCTAERVKC